MGKIWGMLTPWGSWSPGLPWPICKEASLMAKFSHFWHQLDQAQVCPEEFLDWNETWQLSAWGWTENWLDGGPEKKQWQCWVGLLFFKKLHRGLVNGCTHNVLNTLCSLWSTAELAREKTMQLYSSLPVRGMWSKRPSDWASDVPFCDPNNDKPKKEDLERMYDYLLQKYRVSFASQNEVMLAYIYHFIRNDHVWSTTTTFLNFVLTKPTPKHTVKTTTVDQALMQPIYSWCWARAVILLHRLATGSLLGQKLIITKLIKFTNVNNVLASLQYVLHVSTD